MAWLVLICSGALEAVWATALSQIEGLSKPQPIITFLIGATLSMGGLAWALKTIPVGTGYAVWVGIGATTTALWAFYRGAEPVTLLKLAFLAGIIACVIGLQLTSSAEGH